MSSKNPEVQKSRVNFPNTCAKGTKKTVSNNWDVHKIVGLKNVDFHWYMPQVNGLKREKALTCSHGSHNIPLH